MYDSLFAYLPQDRRQALIHGQTLPEQSSGTVLFADLSGFTRLTESLVRTMGARRGAEELAGQINRIYDALLAPIEQYGGSVISFAGDGITCYFNADEGLRAVAAALEMQQVIASLPGDPAPAGLLPPLALKIGIAPGPVRRFLVGNPEIQVLEVLAGETLRRVAQAEQHAQPGQVIIDGTCAYLDETLHLQAGGNPAWPTVTALVTAPTPQPWPPLPGTDLPLAERLRPWLLTSIYERLRLGQTEFVTELRPAVALFLRFRELNYDRDATAPAQLDAYVRWVQQVTTAYEGTLLSLTLGDKGSLLYLAFGAPTSHENDVLRAIEAARAFQHPPAPLSHLGPVQIGISQGLMRVGAYGGTTRRTYSVLGDAVNVAARLMQQAHPGEIVVSEQIQATAGPSILWQALPDIPLKGKQEATRRFALRGASSPGLRLQEPAYTLPMVGREAQLTQLADRLTQTLDGHGQIVAIRGEAGMGKSRLVAEGLRLASVQGITAYGGAGQSHGIHTPYLVWQPIWQAFFGLGATSDPQKAIQHLEQELATLDTRFLPYAPLLAPLLQLPIPDSELTRAFDPVVRKSALEVLLTECLMARAAQGPLLLMLEDAHWVDSLSQDLLEVLGAAVAALPVCVLVTLRPPLGPAQPSATSALPHYSEINLGPLAPPAVASFIQTRLTDQGIESHHLETLVQPLLARTQGNPFYLEELLRYLQEQDALRLAPPELARAELPNSLHRLILSRLDHLSVTEQALLKAASIIGRVFPVEWLQGYYPLGEAEAGQQTLRQLSQTEIVAPLEGSKPTYLFKHALIQEVIYESMPHATRALLHEQLASYLEGKEPDPALLAYHFSQAGNRSKGFTYSLAAAQQARHLHAYESALTWYDQAATFLLVGPEHLTPHLTLHEGRADVLVQHARYEEAIASYHAMRTAAVTLADGASEARAWGKVSEVQTKQCDYAAALESAQAEEQAALSAGAGGQVEYLHALYQQGVIVVRLGNVEEAIRLGEVALAQSRSLGAQDMMAQSLKLLGLIRVRTGHFKEATTYFEQALALYRSLNDQPGVGMLLNNLGVMAFKRGDYEAAIARYSEALPLVRQMGSHDLEALLLDNLGEAYVGLEDYPAAENELQRALQMAERARRGDFVSAAYSYLAEAHLGQNRPQEAWAAAQEALRRAEITGEPMHLGAAWRALGLVHAHPDLVIAGQATKSPPACFAESVRVFRETGAESEHARSLRMWARYELAQGDQVLGERLWREALGLFTQLDMVQEVSRMASLPVRRTDET